jgi:putative tricarboxylic transport membrane protein
MTDSSSGRQDSRGPVKAPRELAAGLFLIAIAAIGLFGGRTLSMGTLSTVGPGMLPKSVAALIAALGILLAVQSFISRGAALERWSLRGLVFVLGAALVFASTIRPLGLAIAGPLAVFISSLAEPENRPLPTVAYAIVLTLFCGLLFKEALNLPIPFDPLDILKPIYGPYVALKASLKAVFLTLIGRG